LPAARSPECSDTHPHDFSNTNELALFPQSTPFYAYNTRAEDTGWEAAAANSISLAEPGKFPFSEDRADPAKIRQTIEKQWVPRVVKVAE
jgi:hypothetical protein